MYLIVFQGYKLPEDRLGQKPKLDDARNSLKILAICNALIIKKQEMNTFSRAKKPSIASRRQHGNAS